MQRLLGVFQRAVPWKHRSWTRELVEVGRRRTDDCREKLILWEMHSFLSFAGSWWRAHPDGLGRGLVLGGVRNKREKKDDDDVTKKTQPTQHRQRGFPGFIVLLLTLQDFFYVVRSTTWFTRVLCLEGNQSVPLLGTGTHTSSPFNMVLYNICFFVILSVV